MAISRSKNPSAKEVRRDDPQGTAASEVNTVSRNARKNDLIQRYLANNTFIQEGRVLDVVGGAYELEVELNSGVRTAKYLPSMSSVVGGGDVTLPNIGDLVLCVAPTIGDVYILGNVDTEGIGETGSLFPVLGEFIDSLSEKQELSRWDPKTTTLLNNKNNGRPLDVMSGDWGHTSDLGAFIGVLRGFISILRASELSQILCLGDDDLIRILSRNYQHWTDLGETNILNDEGEVTLEMVGSGHAHETLGQISVGGEIGEEKDEAADNNTYYPLKNQDATGNWRWRLLLGYLGGALKLWVTQPSEEPTSLPEGFVPGVAEVFITEEGAITIRSAKEILAQKVTKIAVPSKQKNPEDPTGDTRFPPPPTSDEPYAPSTGIQEFQWDEEHPNGRSLEEEDALKYSFNEFHPRRIKDHTKDWKFPTEEEALAPRETTEVEPIEGLEGPPAEVTTVKYIEAVSTFHQRDDGSVFIESTGKASIEATAEGDLIFSCPRDEIHNVGRDIVFLAGNDLVARSKKHMDLSVTEGDFRAKAQGNLHVFSIDKGILLETESDLKSGGSGEDMESGGIVLRSKGQAPIYLHSEADVIRGKAQKDIVLSTDLAFKMDCQQEADLRVGTETKIKSKKATIQLDDEFNVKAKNWNLKSDGGTYRLDVPTIKMSCSTATWAGDAPDSIKIRHKHQESEFSAGPHGHKHSVTMDAEKQGVNTSFNLKQNPHQDPSDSQVPKIQFEFRKEYGIQSDNLYEATWQLNLEASDTWNWGDDELRGSAPWPGQGFTNRFEYEPSGGKTSSPGSFSSVGTSFKIPKGE